jgi:hypothetical protein
MLGVEKQATVCDSSRKAYHPMIRHAGGTSADLTAGTELTSDYRTICDAMREGMDFSQPHSTS